MTKTKPFETYTGYMCKQSPIVKVRLWVHTFGDDV